MKAALSLLAFLAVSLHFAESQSSKASTPSGNLYPARIDCIKGKLPADFRNKLQTICQKQEENKRCVQWGHFRTSFFAALTENPAKTNQADFDQLRTRCAADPKNNSQYHKNKCVLDTMEKDCNATLKKSRR